MQFKCDAKCSVANRERFDVDAFRAVLENFVSSASRSGNRFF